MYLYFFMYSYFKMSIKTQLLTLGKENNRTTLLYPNEGSLRNWYSFPVFFSRAALKFCDFN